VLSDRPGVGTKTLVESQISALTPSSPIASNTASSNGSPTTGSVSSLKSAACTIRPAGVSMIMTEVSGIEWLIGTNCTLNGPASTVSGRGPTVVI
jgi:hypothetical protein